jgi:hypothetical protein
VDVLEDVLRCWCAGFPADNYCIATFDIEIELKGSATEKLVGGLQDLNTREAFVPLLVLALKPIGLN